jgi:hypothetical protein
MMLHHSSSFNSFTSGLGDDLISTLSIFFEHVARMVEKDLAMTESNYNRVVEYADCLHNLSYLRHQSHLTLLIHSTQILSDVLNITSSNQRITFSRIFGKLVGLTHLQMLYRHWLQQSIG